VFPHVPAGVPARLWYLDAGDRAAEFQAHSTSISHNPLGMMLSEDEFLTVADVAAILKVNQQTVRNLALTSNST
jgi:hypothetical protein